MSDPLSENFDDDDVDVLFESPVVKKRARENTDQSTRVLDFLVKNETSQEESLFDQQPSQPSAALEHIVEPASKLLERAPNAASEEVPFLAERVYDEQDLRNVRFIKHMESFQPPELPADKTILAYIAKLKSPEQPAWYEASMKAIIESNKYQYPKQVALRRAYILPFLSQCEPDNPRHRPCARGAHCESMAVGGFVCRELVMPEDWAKVKSVPASQAAAALPKLVGWCYLCHLEHTNSLYWGILDNLNTRRVPSHTAAPRQPLLEAQCHVIHFFIVYVDEPGEYKLENTLQGDKTPMGVYGPFPLYNPDNYRAVEDARTGRFFYEESIELVFRPALEDSPQIVSSPTIRRV